MNRGSYEIVLQGYSSNKQRKIDVEVINGKKLDNLGVYYIENHFSRKVVTLPITESVFSFVETEIKKGKFKVKLQSKNIK